MLLGSSTSLPNSIMSHLFSIPHTGSQLKKRIDFKVASLCFKSLNGSAPTYFSDLLHHYTPSRQLSSSADTRLFRIPSICTDSSGQRSFLYQAPATWNQLTNWYPLHTLCQFIQIFLQNLSLLQNFFFSPTALRCLCVCQGIATAARVAGDLTFFHGHQSRRYAC